MEGGASVFAKFTPRRGRTPQIILARIVRPMNTHDVVGDIFHIKKLGSRLSLSKVRFWMENDRFVFLSPLWGLRGTV